MPHYSGSNDDFSLGILAPGSNFIDTLAYFNNPARKENGGQAEYVTGGFHLCGIFNSFKFNYVTPLRSPSFSWFSAKEKKPTFLDNHQHVPKKRLSLNSELRALRNSHSVIPSAANDPAFPGTYEILGRSAPLE